MKKLILVLILVCIAMLLASCANDKEPKPTFPPDGPLTDPGTGGITPVPEQGNIETSGFLDSDKKVSYVLYTNGTLTLSGAGIHVVIKDNDQLRDKVGKIKEITFGPGVSEIGEKAFRDLTALEKAILSDETETVGEYAFSGCTSLMEVSFGGVTRIGRYAFSGCSGLTTVKLENIRMLDDYAFNNCTSLNTVDIGSHLLPDSMGEHVFANCSGLQNVSINSSVPESALKDITSLKNVIIGDHAGYIGQSAFSGCTALSGISIGKNVTKIGAYAFENNSSLTGVSLPDGIRAVEENTFLRCEKLNKVVLPAKLIEIQANAFKDCSGLMSIDLPDGLEAVHQYAFSGCGSLQTIVLPGTLKSIGTRAFENCGKLTNLTLSDALMNADTWVCPSCNSENNPNDIFCINCSASRNSASLDIGSYAFYGCSSLGELNLDVNKIDDYAFYECTALKRITIHAGSIGNNAFQGCSGLLGADISVTGSIGNQAFMQCTSMTDLSLRSDRVGSQAFQGCTLLCNVTLDSNDIGTQAFSECGSIVEIDFNARKIGNQALEKCNGLKKVVFSNPEVELGSKILLDCSIDRLVAAARVIPKDCFASASVKNVVLTNTVEEIGESAFEGCEMLTEIVIPSTITRIENFAFKECGKLETIVDENNQNVSVPEGTVYLGRRIFDGCSGLKTLEIRAEEIGEESFARMPSLETFTVSRNVKIIKKHAFEDCRALRIVDLKEADEASVEIIEAEAFKGCASLEKFRLPATLKKMGNRVFLDCDENTFRVLVFGGTKAEWNRVDVSKKYKEWTGFKRKNTGMGEWCKDGRQYKNWKNN